MCSKNAVSLEMVIFPVACCKQTGISYVYFSKILFGASVWVLNGGYAYAALC